MATHSAEDARRKKLILASGGLLVVAGLVLAWTWRRPAIETRMPVAIEPTDEPIDVAEETEKKVRERSDRPANRDDDQSKPEEPERRKKQKQDEIPKPKPKAGIPF